MRFFIATIVTGAYVYSPWFFKNQQTKKMGSKNFIVAIKHAPHTGNFFIDLSDENGYIISVKISQGVTEGLSKNLGLKIII